MEDLKKFQPLYQAPLLSSREAGLVNPFFTNLDQSVYACLIPSPELIGALVSRTSRAAGDLREIFLREFILPFLEPKMEDKETEELWKEKINYSRALSAYFEFCRKVNPTDIFSNPRARSFYTKWLAQYGDDSIAQMAGMHLVYGALSQIAIKHLEDQRIGLAPIEKSTRYVNYGEKSQGRYLYYTDPEIARMGLVEKYKAAENGLFDTYRSLLPKLADFLRKKFPKEKPAVVEKKAFDTLRGLLPTSTISQVAFFGNGQSFEYMISRSAKHSLGEIRWAAERAYEELARIAPSFLRRLEKDTAQDYQSYLAGRKKRVGQFICSSTNSESLLALNNNQPSIRLVEFDPEGEDKIIASILFDTHGSRESWEILLARVKIMSRSEKKRVLEKYFEGRTERWQKVGRALENSFIRFEIIMNIGAWRDLHRHRMHTQQRQQFSCELGFDTPPELVEAKLVTPYQDAIGRLQDVYSLLCKRDAELAQYAVTLAHRVRFMQYQNLRESFWEIELRTIPEGHPDYRRVEQEKFRLLECHFPLLAKFMRVNLGEYDFARRGQEEKIQKKLQEF